VSAFTVKMMLHANAKIKSYKGISLLYCIITDFMSLNPVVKARVKTSGRNACLLKIIIRKKKNVLNW